MLLASFHVSCTAFHCSKYHFRTIALTNAATSTLMKLWNILGGRLQRKCGTAVCGRTELRKLHQFENVRTSLLHLLCFFYGSDFFCLGRCVRHSAQQIERGRQFRYYRKVIIFARAQYQKSLSLDRRVVNNRSTFMEEGVNWFWKAGIFGRGKVLMVSFLTQQHLNISQERMSNLLGAVYWFYIRHPPPPSPSNPLPLCCSHPRKLHMRESCLCRSGASSSFPQRATFASAEGTKPCLILGPCPPNMIDVHHPKENRERDICAFPRASLYTFFAKNLSTRPYSVVSYSLFFRNTI